MTRNENSLYVRINFSQTPNTYTVMRGTKEVEPAPSYEAGLARVSVLTAERAKGRTRTVYPSREIAHLWMHKAIETARNGGRTFYFEGDTIYSYGSHFPIARHITNEQGEPAILFTIETYSKTTHKHCADVRRAIPKDARVFHVASLCERWGSGLAHDLNIASYVSRMDENITRGCRARSTWNVEHHLGIANSLRSECIAYCEFFGVPVPELETVPEPNPEHMEALRAHERGRDNAKRERARIAEEERRRKLEANLEAWLRGETVYGGLPDWLPTALRVNGDMVETTRGASFPVSHARRGLALVRAVMASGQEWRRNGHQCRLGFYHIDRITPEGTVHAGCHCVPFESIARIEPALLALPEPEEEPAA